MSVALSHPKARSNAAAAHRRRQATAEILPWADPYIARLHREAREAEARELRQARLRDRAVS